MKSLDQIEPRTPIPGGSTATPFVIGQSGSYVLNGNLTLTASGDGIDVQADNVSIDLNGFTITGVTGDSSGSAIALVGTRKNVTVRNGVITGGTTLSGSAFTTAGFYYGIFIPFGSRNLLVENVSISNVACGIDDVGNSDGSSIARGCSISTVATNGVIVALAENCTVTDAGETGIGATSVLNCVARTLSNASYASAISGEIVQNCRGTNLTGQGYGINGTTVSNSTGRSDAGIGISAETASYCQGNSNSSIGLAANIAIGCSGSSVSAVNKYLMP